MEMKGEGKTKQAEARATDICELWGDNDDVNGALSS